MRPVSAVSGQQASIELIGSADARAAAGKAGDGSATGAAGGAAAILV